MSARRWILLTGFIAALASPLSMAGPAPFDTPSDDEELFALKVSRLISDKCASCHGADPDKIKANLDLTSLEGALRGGDTSDKVLVPGKAEESLMFLAVQWADPDYEMPPKQNDRLSEEQTWQVRDWINAGAPWPDDERVARIREQFDEGIFVKTSGGLSEDWTHRRYRSENLWAYQPLKSADGPDAEGVAIPPRDNPIDAFIGRHLGEIGLTPAPRADRQNLIRRVTYDLIGLPPTPEEVAEFLNDPGPGDKAFSKVIDRLLASPHYGEHWARHWLDVVRYADSSGFANDYERGNAWRYRDYVIRAFNDDKPFDLFVIEQIAGDELYDAAPDGTRNVEGLIASGFLRMGPWELTGMEVAKVARQRFLDDIVDSVGQTFLGHPLRCARCHDHKFDPIPTRDYYNLQAVFATTQPAERQAEFLEHENTSGFAERKYLEARKDTFEKNLRRLRAKEEAAAREWAKSRGLEYIPRNEGLKKGVAEEKLPPKKIGFSVEDYGMERISRKGIERLRWELERYTPIALSAYSGATPNRKSVNAPLRVPVNRKAGDVELTSILAGGDPFSPVEPAHPAPLSVVNGIVPGLSEIHFDKAVGGRRVQLARWIAHPRNSLTARTLVNRLWQWHFGKGIAATPNNLGATGKKPTHPELLDWLAVRFVKNGFSIKHMHRLILMSEAYRRSCNHPNPEMIAKKDPTHTSYAVFEPRRITAEELRDSMLAVSGELNPALGGIPNRPEINLEAALQPRMVMGTFASAWQPNPHPEERHRRSIYALKIRGLRDPFMEVFDEPSPDLSCEARESSTGTPQVFSLFNSQKTLDRAVAFALRLLGEADSDETIVRRAFQLAYGRNPARDETQACLAHWRTMTQCHTQFEPARYDYPKKVIREAVEENTGEKFAFAEPLEFYEDFVPDKKLADVDPRTRGLAELCLVLLNSNEFVYVY